MVTSSRLRFNPLPLRGHLLNVVFYFEFAYLLVKLIYFAVYFAEKSNYDIFWDFTLFIIMTGMLILLLKGIRNQNEGYLALYTLYLMIHFLVSIALLISKLSPLLHQDSAKWESETHRNYIFTLFFEFPASVLWYFTEVVFAYIVGFYVLIIKPNTKKSRAH